MAKRPDAGGLNLLNLKARPRRRQGMYWASVIVSIVAHGGFLAYLLAYARPSSQPQPRATGVNVEVIGAMPFKALLRSDLERPATEPRAEATRPLAIVEERGEQHDATDSAVPDASDIAKPASERPPEDRARTAAPPAIVDAGGEQHDATDSGESSIAKLIGEPLPEDRARAAAPPAIVDASGQWAEAVNPGALPLDVETGIEKLFGEPLPEDRASSAAPPAERLPERVLGTAPRAVRPVAIALPATRAIVPMTVPARRMAHIARDARLSERRAMIRLDDSLTAVDTTALPQLKLLVAPEQSDAASGLEQRRASALDTERERSPVVSELPKEAGVAMFTARIFEGEARLPEDRAVAPVLPMPTRGADARAAPLNAFARLADGQGAQNPRRSGMANKNPGGVADARAARAYRLTIRAHLTANRPAGVSTAGRAVVTFRLTAKGGVRSVRITRSSGSPLLDRSVLQAVSRAVPFPKPPPGLKPDQLRFVIPFEFQ